MLLEDLGDYLSSQGGFVVGGTTGDLFLGRMPTDPLQAMTIYEYGGRANVHAMHASPGQAKEETVRVQFVSRAADYATARAVAQKAYLLIDGFPTRSINGCAYKWGTALQPPFLMGRDNEQRPLIAFNAEIWKELSTTS